jgi:hypothetical protein
MRYNTIKRYRPYIMTRLQSRILRFGVRFLLDARDFFLLHRVQTSRADHTALYSMTALQYSGRETDLTIHLHTIPEVKY